MTPAADQTGTTAVASVSAVVVVHHPDPVGTERALRSLLASDGVTVRLVVAYNGQRSGEGAVAALASRLGATFVPCGVNRGFAAAVNQALSDVPPDHHVFLLNDDAWVEPATLRRCVDCLVTAPGPCVSVAPLVLHADRQLRVDSLGVVLRPNGEAFNAHIGRLASDVAGPPSATLGPCFSAALLRAGSLGTDQVGLLDERYFLYYEDVDWNARAMHRGFTSTTAPDAVAYHQHAQSTRKLGESRRYGMVQRNLLLFAAKELSARGATRVWAGRLVVHAKGLVTGPHRQARLAAFAGALARLPGVVRARRAARGSSPATDAALTRFSAGMVPSFDIETYAPPGD